MIFGDRLEIPSSASAAQWISPSLGGSSWTVGALVPNHFSTVMRISAPEPQPVGWWTAYRDVYEVVASVGAQHTTTPNSAWFAVWEGHGFDRAVNRIAWPDPAPDDATRDARAA